MRTDKLLHAIDKKLAVLEAISKAHAIDTEGQFNALKVDLAAVKQEVSNLKVKVAGVAAIASIVVNFAIQKWGG